MYVSLAKATRDYKKLEVALDKNEVTPSKAARVLSVIELENEQEWVLKASRLSKAQLEKEVARLNPKKVRGERSEYLTPDVIELKIPVKEEVYKLLVRAQDLLSDSKGQAATMEEVFEHLAHEYLKKRDPLKKAKRRAEKRGFNDSASSPAQDQWGHRFPIPSEVIHQVHLRDERRCQHRYPSGEQCQSTGLTH
jgi:hypothetical protein